MTALPSPDPWIRTWRISAQPRARLVCLPHAGGSAGYFRTWCAALPADIDLLAVQYPGRDERYAEPMAGSLHELADATAHALGPHADRPLVLLGHSMGASIAYETALRLEADGIAPLRLFVSAHPPPHRQRASSLHRGDDDGLLGDVRALAGGIDGPLAHPEARALFMPLLRGDYRVIETYRRDAPVRLHTPIDVLRPLDDTSLTDGEARAWQDVTRGPSEVIPFEGGHFYLRPQRDLVVARLLERIACSPTVHEGTA